MRYKVIVVLLFVFLFSGHVFSQAVSTPNRSVTKLSDKLYVIRHKDAPDGYPQGNTTVIIGDKKVIVVDACYLPSSAREDIEFIKKLTRKPVDYLINTHWHADHQQGNPEYLKAFPDIKIIARKETAEEIMAFENKDLARYRQNLDSLKIKVKNGKNGDGKPLAVADLANMKELAAGQDSVENELLNYTPVYPNIIISGGIDLDIGDQVVKLMCMAPVHTLGDLMLFLPDQKILITGDVLVYPIPYFFGGAYPYSGVKVLETIDQMDVKTFVPGHGEVLNNKIYLEQEIDLIKNVISLVEAEVYKEGLLGIKLENVQRAIDLGTYKKQFSNGIKENEVFFDESISKGLVEGCFNGMAK